MTKIVTESMSSEEAARKIKALRSTNSNDEAIAFGEQWLATPGNVACPRVLCSLASSYENTGNIERTQALLDRALELAPEDVGTLAIMGNFLKRQGKHDAAQTYIDRSIALDPHNPNSKTNIAISIMRGHGSRTKAREFLEAALAEKRDPITLSALAGIELLEGRLEQAKSLWRESLAVSTQDTHADYKAQLGMGIIAMREGLYDSAQQFLAPLSSGHKKHVAVELLLAVTELRRGQQPAALDRIRRTLLANPFNPSTMRIYKGLAESGIGTNEYNAMLQAIQRTSSFPKNQSAEWEIHAPALPMPDYNAALNAISREIEHFAMENMFDGRANGATTRVDSSIAIPAPRGGVNRS